MTKIVLTGGPGAGKSVISARLAKGNPAFVNIPESATQVFSGLQTRWDRVSPEGLRNVQRAIYQRQLEQEAYFAKHHSDRILILDRGTIDGAAYWPDGPEAFWKDVNTTLPDELARYDMVILLETAATLGIYDGDASNPVRFEDAAGAIESGKLLQKLWGGHPKIFHVGAFANLGDKVAAVVEVIGTFVGKTK